MCLQLLVSCFYLSFVAFLVSGGFVGIHLAVVIREGLPAATELLGHIHHAHAGGLFKHH